MYSLEQFENVVAEMLLKHDFRLPITFTMIGINGHVFAGRFELSIVSKKAKVIILTGKAKKLRFPINVLLVDKSAKAAHVYFEGPKEPVQPTIFQVGQA